MLSAARHVAAGLTQTCRQVSATTTADAATPSRSPSAVRRSPWPQRLTPALSMRIVRARLGRRGEARDVVGLQAVEHAALLLQPLDAAREALGGDVDGERRLDQRHDVPEPGLGEDGQGVVQRLLPDHLDVLVDRRRDGEDQAGVGRGQGRATRESGCRPGREACMARRSRTRCG